MRQAGAIPAQMIEEMIETCKIVAEEPVPAANIQPASLDLRLGKRGYRVRASFLPRPDESIEQALKNYKEEELDLTSGVILRRHHTYVLELMEELHLPDRVHAYANNKSSTGRMNVWVRTLVDRLSRFDKVPLGYQGKVYVMVTPRSWPIKVAQGSTLNQARFLVGDNRLNDLELEMAQERIGLLYDEDGRKVDIRPHLDKGILLTADLDQEVVGYRALDGDKMVDLTSKEPHPFNMYWEPVEAKNGEVLLFKGAFYILSTREFLRVPPGHAVEMVAYDIHSGEYRSHYAGFFDPGFGHGRDGQILGTPAVLEVDPHEDVVFRHGQPICKMVYEHLIKDPDRVYGEELTSHYQHQRGPQLGRHFSKPVPARS